MHVALFFFSASGLFRCLGVGGEEGGMRTRKRPCPEPLLTVHSSCNECLRYRETLTKGPLASFFWSFLGTSSIQPGRWVRVGQNLSLSWKRQYVGGRVCEKTTALHTWDPQAGLGKRRLGFLSFVSLCGLGYIRHHLCTSGSSSANGEKQKASERCCGDEVKVMCKSLVSCKALYELI